MVNIGNGSVVGIFKGSSNFFPCHIDNTLCNDWGRSISGGNWIHVLHKRVTGIRYVA